MSWVELRSTRTRCFLHTNAQQNFRNENWNATIDDNAMQWMECVRWNNVLHSFNSPRTHSGAVNDGSDSTFDSKRNVYVLVSDAFFVSFISPFMKLTSTHNTTAMHSCWQLSLVMHSARVHNKCARVSPIGNVHAKWQTGCCHFTWMTFSNKIVHVRSSPIASFIWWGNYVVKMRIVFRVTHTHTSRSHVSSKQSHG